MANITITSTNIAPGSNTFKMRWRLITGGSWSSYYNILAIPFTFSTPHPLDTNYELEIYQDCGTSQSTSTFYPSNFTPTCNIVSITNVVVGTCNLTDNTYSLSFDVTYTGMKDSLGTITSVMDVILDSVHHSYHNPTNASGTQTITITGLNSDAAIHNLTVNCLAS